ALEAIKGFEQQKPVVAAQARKSQEGLDIALTAGIEYDAALREHQDRVQSIGASAATEFDAVVEKAEGAAVKAAWNVAAGLREIEMWSTEIMNKLDANKARDIAVGIQATVEGMNEVDRQMQAQYGVGSDEYMQYKTGKANSLGRLLQNLQTTHATLTTQIGVQFADLKAKYKTEAEMYASFERQLSINIAKDMELAKASLNMQVSEEIAGLDMLLTANQENIANWIIETPVFGMDSSAMIGFMGSLAIEQWSGDQAARAAEGASKAAVSAGKMSMWGSIAGAGMLLALCDETMKENIEPLKEACDMVCQVSGYSYNYTFDPLSRRSGIMAQDLEKVLPEGVVTHKGIKFVRLDAVGGLLMSSMKELIERVKKLEEKSNA
ncbi:hypothetical protein LCGC14_2810940, partial [marine sediment metagenome]